MAVRFWQRVDWLFEHRRLLRRVLLVWFMVTASVMVGFLMWAMVVGSELINGALATIYTSFFGLLSIVAGIYNWKRSSDTES